jgi:uncharacterized membrane protein
MAVLDYFALAIALAGVTIIVWGILRTCGRFILFEIRGLRVGCKCRGRESIRHQLGSYMLLGLEFLIAADIIETVRNPDLRDIAVLGAIVAIRTVISYFLNRELAETDT